MRGHGSQWISNKINIRHLGQLKKWKSWELFCSYQINSTANPAHLPQNRAKLAKSPVLFSWKLQNGSQDFDFFNCHGCRLSILCEIHCYLDPHILWVYYFSLSQCDILGSSSTVLPACQAVPSVIVFSSLLWVLGFRQTKTCQAKWTLIAFKPKLSFFCRSPTTTRYTNGFHLALVTCNTRPLKQLFGRL